MYLPRYVVQLSFVKEIHFGKIFSHLLELIWLLQFLYFLVNF
jgi:hypothetical protein